MKITSVDILSLHPRNDPMPRPVVCRINTDEGIFGYGEAVIAYGKGSPAAVVWLGSGNDTNDSANCNR